MNILDTVGISLPCRSCGSTYQVPLRDVLLSHTILHDGCPASKETECPPVFQSRLFESKDIEELQHAWNQLEQRARADGGELVFMAAGPSSEMQPTDLGKAVASLRGQSQASVPIPLASAHTRERVAKQSGKPKKARVGKQAHSKSRTRKNRKVA